jgi:hypothetical protein
MPIDTSSELREASMNDPIPGFTKEEFAGMFFAMMHELNGTLSVCLGEASLRSINWTPHIQLSNLLPKLIERLCGLSMRCGGFTKNIIGEKTHCKRTRAMFEGGHVEDFTGRFLN